ncbi:cell wall protein [Actinacidiphila acididurans]|uniref:Cell wall protein n=1 Tax=Actinacidiphila acididurans TaxID=2784346 RepID=A0ABS2U5N2_9ACTN|nr:cell wall protein [Actinacidiphila acididurans]MBM9510026.1 cell wall protein [Actinacidiphila acididurans]
MTGAAQEVEHTSSRRSGPRRWLRAVVWLIAAGLHPRAGATTLRVAEDLAGRMDYDSGQVRYCLDETAARLGVDRATVKRHVKILRELGALAWAQHGTRTNIRRVLGLPGYAGTATVYAAVIPPVYDRAMGHRVIGSGYGARIVVDLRKPGPVDNSSAGPAGAPCAPPSLNVVKGGEQKVEVVGGCKDTSCERASRTTESTPPTTSKRAAGGRGEKRSERGGGARRSPAQVARDCRIAAQVRPLVNWTQAEGIRRLAYALRPLIDQGLDAQGIAAELGAWWLTWRPQQPAAYIRVRLAEQAARDAETAAAVEPSANAEWRAWTQRQAALAALTGADVRTDVTRRTARQDAWHDPQIVVDHIEDYGEDDALDLYGPRLVSMATRLNASGARFTARW